MAKTDTLKIDVELDMSQLITEMQSAARALRGFGMTLAEAADALELVLKKFEVKER